MKTETYQQHITAEIRLTKAELSQVEIRAEKLKARIAYLQKLKAEAK